VAPRVSVRTIRRVYLKKASILLLELRRAKNWSWDARVKYENS
jgi:hypothetical protein